MCCCLKEIKMEKNIYFLKKQHVPFGQPDLALLRASRVGILS